MSKEHLERFMKQVTESEDLQAKIGEEITGDALVALGAAHGCECSMEDLQADAELSDEELEGVAGGLGDQNCTEWVTGASKLRHRRASSGLALQGGRFTYSWKVEEGES